MVASIMQGLHRRLMPRLDNHHNGSLMYGPCCKHLNQRKKPFNIQFHQQNVSLSLGASGSVWKLSDQNPRVVKFKSILDWCSGLYVQLGAPATNLGGHGRFGDNLGRAWECRQQAWKHQEVPATSLGAPKTSLGASMTCLGVLLTSLRAPQSTSEMPGSTWNDGRAVWGKQLLWERCWCTSKS